MFFFTSLLFVSLLLVRSSDGTSLSSSVLDETISTSALLSVWYILSCRKSRTALLRYWAPWWAQLTLVINNKRNANERILKQIKTLFESKQEVNILLHIVFSNPGGPHQKCQGPTDFDNSILARNYYLIIFFLGVIWEFSSKSIVLVFCCRWYLPPLSDDAVYDLHISSVKFPDSRNDNRAC